MKLARFIAGLFVPRSEREFFLGDLDEEFVRRRQMYGGRMARRWYWKQALGLRDYRRPEHSGGEMKTLWLDHLVRDCRASIRSMAGYPVACIVAVISLALGIGCTTAALTIRDAVFYSAPPLYRNPEGLSYAGVSSPERPDRQDVSPRLYEIWAADTGPVSGIAASTASVHDVRTTDGSEAMAVRAITPELFSLLGVRPEAGRAFTLADLQHTSTSPAILSHQVWHRVFQGSAEAIGREVWIDDQPHTVVGVMPERFWYADMEQTIWTPLDVHRLGSAERVDVVIRRNADTTPAMLSQALQRGFLQYVATLPESERNLRVQLEAVTGTPLAHQVGYGIVVLLGACVLLTLLISCTNVAVLMIAQWTAREREIAIRSSLGASRWRIVRLLLTESVLIAALGGVLGVCATFALVGLMSSRGPIAFHQFNVSINASVLMESIAITLFTGILAGIAPALYETRRLQKNPMRLISSDRVRQRWRNALVVVEITVTVALLVVTSMMVDSYWRALSWDDSGFDSKRLVLTDVENPDGVKVAGIRDRLSGIPGVISASASTTMPMIGMPGARRVATDAAESNALMAGRSIVGINFFSTLGIPFRRGRSFTEAEEGNAASHVVVVNQTLAQRMWPGREALGETLFLDKTGYEIIGVVVDHSWTSLRKPGPDVFLPLSQLIEVPKRIRFVVRTPDPAALLASVRSEVRNFDHGNRISAWTSQAVMNRIGAEILSVVFPMTPLIATGILLTCAGIYSVLAFAITRRSKELAVRMAVGASRLDLLKLVAGLTIRLVATGMLFGIGATYGASRIAQGRGGPFDSPRMWVYVVPFGIVLLIGVLATLVPSRRAVSINPAVLLRSE